MRSLGKVFSGYLPEVAFIRDWIGPAGLRADLKLAPNVPIGVNVAKEAHDIMLAWDQYKEELAEITRQVEARRRERQKVGDEGITDDSDEDLAYEPFQDS